MYTWTQLMDDIKVKGMIPTSQNTFTEERLLSITNNVLLAKLLPQILKARESYYSYDIDTAVNASGVYDIHTRAVGGKLDNVALVDGDRRKDLAMYFEDEITNLGQPPDGKPGFFIKRNQFTILPTDGAGYSSVRQTIFLRPARIVANSAGAQVTAFNTGTKVVTFAEVPSSWTTASLLDIVQGQPHFDTLAINQVITAVTTGSGGTVTFSSALPDRLAIGDWVSLFGESPVPQVPAEFNSLLSQYAANECLKNGSDPKALETGIADAKDLLESLMGVITPRVEREGKVLVNRTGMLRRGL